MNNNVITRTVLQNTMQVYIIFINYFISVDKIEEKC